MAAGKTPGPIGDNPDAKSPGAVQRKLLNDTVLYGDVLSFSVHNPDIGVAGSLNLSQV
jgi:hypothetical protein